MGARKAPASEDASVAQQRGTCPLGRDRLHRTVREKRRNTPRGRARPCGFQHHKRGREGLYARSGQERADRVIPFSRGPVRAAQEGSYVSSMKAVTPVIAYRIPVASLRKQFSTDAALEFHVIAKLCHELRQAQRHAFVLASKHNGFEADAVPPDVGASSSRQRRADQRDISAHGPLRHLRICRHFAFGRQQGVPSPYGPRDPESPEPTTRKGHRPLRLRGDHPRRRYVATGKGAIRSTAHR
jgi:hypothetical protein